MSDVSRPIGPVPRARARARVAATACRSRPGRSTARRTARVASSMAVARAAVGQERRRVTLGIDTGVMRQVTSEVDGRRGDPRADDRLGRGAVGEPGAELVDVGRRCRRRHQDRDTASGRRRSIARPRSASRSRRIRGRSVAGQAIGLVDDDGLAVEPRDPRSQEARRASTASWYFSRSVTQATASTNGRSASTRSRWLVGPSPCRAGRGWRPNGRPSALCSPDVAHPEPAEQRRQRLALRRRDPGDRLARRRATHGGGADVDSRQGVEQARLADTRPADEGEHVGVRREAEATRGVGMRVPDRVGRDAEDVGRIGRFEQRIEAAPERVVGVVERRWLGRRGVVHPAGLGRARTSAAAARRSVASSARTPGAGSNALEPGALLLEGRRQRLVEASPRVRRRARPWPPRRTARPAASG